MPRRRPRVDDRRRDIGFICDFNSQPRLGRSARLHAEVGRPVGPRAERQQDEEVASVPGARVAAALSCLLLFCSRYAFADRRRVSCSRPQHRHPVRGGLAALGRLGALRGAPRPPVEVYPSHPLSRSAARTSAAAMLASSGCFALAPAANLSVLTAVCQGLVFRTCAGRRSIASSASVTVSTVRGRKLQSLILIGRANASVGFAAPRGGATLSWIPRKTSPLAHSIALPLKNPVPFLRRLVSATCYTSNTAIDAARSASRPTRPPSRRRRPSRGSISTTR